MRLRRWHRLRIILTIIGGIGLFYYLFTRDDELGEDIFFRQTNECRVAERRGCRRQRAKVIRPKSEEAAIVTAGAIVSAWVAAFISIGLYRWVMAGTPNRQSGGNRRRAATIRSSLGARHCARSNLHAEVARHRRNERSPTGASTFLMNP